MKKILLSLFAIFCLLATADAKNYTHTFKDGDITTAGGIITLNNIEWNATEAKNIAWNNQGKGIQIGNKSTVCKAYSLSTSTSAFYESTITKITVYSSIASSGDAKMTIKVGNAKSEEYTLTTTNTAYTFECKEQGDITISWTATQRA